MTERVSRIAADAANTEMPIAQRCRAVDDLLAAADPGRAREVLLEIAANEADSEVLLRHVGRALGILATAHGYLSEWDLRDMSEVAYEEYDRHYGPSTPKSSDNG